MNMNKKPEVQQEQYIRFHRKTYMDDGIANMATEKMDVNKTTDFVYHGISWSGPPCPVNNKTAR